MKLSIVPKEHQNASITKLKLNVQKRKEFNEGFESDNTKPYQGPTAADTLLYTPRTHVYKRPEMWMGANADIFIEEETWLYNTEEQKIYKKMIRYVPGVERIFIEIAANAADNGNMSRRKGGSVGELEITMNNSHISIKNIGGFPMPVETHPGEPDKYVPEVSFGRLLTSRHYEQERNESGTNGVGSKATNIFSKEFACVVFDNVRHKKYTQVWGNNMRVCNPPTIEDYNGKTASLEIIYKMDFTRFGYPEPNGTEGGYPIELIHLFARHASDFSFTTKMPVTFNGIKFNNSNLRDYGRLYFGDLVDTAVIHYQWPAGTEVIKKKKGYQIAKDPAILPDVELLALDTPDSSDHVSFANSLMTKNGGIHANAAIKAVADSTVKMINEEMSTKNTKGKKSKDTEEKKMPTITINDVKPHISILLSVRVLNPKFDGQEKTKLLESKPAPKINVSEDSLKVVGRWKLVDRLYLALEAKQMKSLKGNGRMQANVRTKKGTKANKAGTSESHKCTLYITEGDSGDLYVETLTTLLPGGSNYAGRLPMKGKSLNAMNASIFEILRNPEFNQLNKMLGLIPGADYMDDANYSKLRYGSLMIAADSDVDGKHITGLILLYFHRCFPALLARGFVLNYLTPIVGVRYKGHFYKFYSQVAYENWMRATPDSSKISADDHKYYKGLASSEDPDIEADFKDPHIVHCFYDIDAPDALSLAFEKGREDERKNWLTNWKPLTEESNFNQQLQPISWFINNELILHSWDNVLRTLPRLMDGLKEGHRKIIYAMHLQWAIGSKKKTYKEEKVAGFSGYVAGHTAYHHGEAILAKTIVGMAQDFIGSNNIPYLAKKGQFGTRSKLGRKAGQPRYIHTYPMPIVASIFDKKDTKILKHKDEEGKKIEPEQYLPKVPMILINGATGIGTGWSSYTPPHNPLDILKCLRILLHGGSPSNLPRLVPWFRNFLGTIEIINRKNKTKIVVKGSEDKIVETEIVTETDDKVVDDDSNTDDSRTDLDDNLPGEFVKEDKEDKDAKKQLYSMKITGNFEILKNEDILITELPVGRAPFDYMKWLEKLVDEKKIKGFDDNCAKDKVSFTIFGYTGTPTHKNLLLEKTKGLSNMYLLDENNKPAKYDDANQILVKWFELRLPFYQKRKDYMIQKIDDEIMTMKYKIIFYTEVVINKTIELVGVRRAEIYTAMDALGVPRDIYTGGKLPNLSVEGIQELNDEILLKQQEKADLEKISIQQMMLTDLDEFEKVYRREFKIKDKVIKLKVGGNNNNNTSTKTTTNNKVILPPTQSTIKYPTNNGPGKTGKQVNKPKLRVVT
jgi:DNA topoisomerase-2